MALPQAQCDPMIFLKGRYLNRIQIPPVSSFGAVPLNLAESEIDYLVSSANKCIEGVSGFSFVLARREALLATEGYARSVCLDLLAQWQGLETNGQFRFTPPTHRRRRYYNSDWKKPTGA